MISRAVARATRARRDQVSDQLAELPTGQDVIVTVTATSPSLTVSWRGASVPVKRLSAYTPTVGDRVQLRVIDGQPIIQGKIV